MNTKNLLVKVLGFPATLIHWDPMVLDRWLWLKKRFAGVPHGQRVLDVGCGGGAFTIGLARLGHRALGLTYDEPSQRRAVERAALCSAPGAAFLLCDARQLARQADLRESFDAVICFECIEHILDDERLMADMAACLRPGGRLLLTTPNEDYIPITPGDAGPFPLVETGWHVRKGYGAERLRELSARAGLEVVEISFCSGFLSQKITWLLRILARLHSWLGLAVILPLRLLPPLLDPILSRLFPWPAFSICLEARKPIPPAIGH